MAMAPHDEETLEYWRQALEESVEFFSARNKGAIEQWACTQFLTNLGVVFRADEVVVVPPGSDPPDVVFRDACFEIKEILDRGRRRHDEYKKALSKARSATDPSEWVEYVTPKDITPIEIGNLIYPASKELVSRKYVEPRFRSSLDPLFYVNLTHHFFKNTGPMPDSEAFATFGFRSISVLIGWAALVLCASSSAPEFLRWNVGKITVHETAKNTYS